MYILIRFCLEKLTFFLCKKMIIATCLLWLILLENCENHLQFGEYWFVFLSEFDQILF